MKQKLEKIKNKKILFIEDEKEIIENMKVLLRKIKNKILFIEDGEEALEYIKTNKENIDIIIIDIFLPNKNAFEIITELKELKINIPTVIITGCIEEKYIEKVKELSVSLYLEKPIMLIELIKELESKDLI